MGAVRVNQMGYSLNCDKLAVFVGKGNAFFIYEKLSGQMVLQGNLIKKGLDENSGDYVNTIDFSSFNKPGDYYIVVNNDSSPVFTIDEDQYRICTEALLKAFYYQRCGVELQEHHAGVWRHPICHLQPSYLFCEEAEELLENNPDKLIRIDTTGGWHDAGDYGRYTIATVKAVADLLSTVHYFPEVTIHPKSNQKANLGENEFLKEARIGLNFLFKMQREDGAVYTKVATRYFPGMIMPEDDMEPLFIFDISSPATAGFSAVMAMASQSFQEEDPEYARKCLVAAEKSYEWLKSNPEPLYFTNPLNISSGEYGDNCDIDERYWAAAQLYHVTGIEQYHNDFIMYYLMLKDVLSFGWMNVGGYGTAAYLFTNRPVNQEVYTELKNQWLKFAVKLEERSREDGYNITLSTQDYIWGSNMVLMNHCIHLILTERLLKSSIYSPVIQFNWDYLFGKNPMDCSYVTGMGERSIKHPHHRPSASDQIEDPIPGLVAGGPCTSLSDDAVRSLCQGMPPAKCFVDHEDSYSTNEIDIYWSSPTVFVGAYLCSKLGNS